MAVMKESNYSGYIRGLFCVSSALLLYIFTQYIWYDQASDGFAALTHYHFSGIFNLDLAFGLDGISLLFLLLTSFIFPSCFLLSRSMETISGDRLFVTFTLFIFLMEFILFLVFYFLDLFLFYLSFEAVLIPMFMLIGQ